MPTLEINGHGRVWVDDSFLSLTREQQQATVEEIAANLRASASVIEVELPDGSIAEFPDGTPPETIKAALQKKFGGGPKKNYDLADVPEAALSNLGSSAGQALSDLAQPFLHPIDTANAIGDIAGGLASKAGIMEHDESAADAVGQFFADRYGSMDAVKRTMAEDPVGFLSDVGTILSAGGLAGARAAGVTGKLAKVAGKVGDVVDPVSLAMKGAGAATRTAGGVTARALGLSTGVGGDAIKEMARAGAMGNRAALEQLRDIAPMADITDSAHRALGDMTADRAAQFQADMAPVKANQTRLPFQDVARSMFEARKEIFHNGKPKDTRAAAALADIRSLVREYASDPRQHTAMGFDALKQRIGEIRDGTEAGTLARRTADKVYRATRETIAKRVPEYDVAQKGYQNATETLNDLRREFSLTEGAATNTAMRKLLSSMRNNVNTNFGERERMMRELAKRESALPGMIAGRNLNAWEPRGMARVVGAVLGAPHLAAVNPWMLAAVPAMSPRVVGEAAYAAGNAASVLTPDMMRLIGRTSYQAGRATTNANGKKRAPAARSERW
ncbi:hypothetical protein GOC87_18825 [Sinorhizobium meliloti]|uniref:hypothetical protein n=1 Tax=Rhizobium meliloti TaxID=382 RepID=UPI000B4A012F|nr:hypothetical protein [Sinorhizobium meliloti]ASP96713.1 hypothetical protein CDO24_04245 [Sinorhizobium meliloti]MDW9705639.1 hypothetical protein [Sinorhizobium meliloti]MDW9935377.1 hypothetical protein [Sinorhizobium meliloti]MQV69699.1 hypothetical protein [Sinorhizobium meliloti]RVQ38381.1 hypothetical protein CN065_15265 [Sinorhizobium meliloti]